MIKIIINKKKSALHIKLITFSKHLNFQLTETFKVSPTQGINLRTRDSKKRQTNYLKDMLPL